MEPITDESDVQSMYSLFYAYVCVVIKGYRKIAIASKQEGILEGSSVGLCARSKLSKNDDRRRGRKCTYFPFI